MFYTPILRMFFSCAMLFGSIAMTAQCTEYIRLMNEAQKYWSQSKFKLAFAKLNSAREACPEKGKEIDAKNDSFNIDLVERNKQLGRQKSELEKKL